MKTNSKRVGKPDTASAYDWLTPEDVIRHALAAYYCSCRAYDRWLADEDDPGADPQDMHLARRSLAEQLAEEFSDRIHHHGYSRQLPGFHRNEYFLRRLEYVDNTRQKLSEITSKSNIHCRFIGTDGLRVDRAYNQRTPATENHRKHLIRIPFSVQVQLLLCALIPVFSTRSPWPELRTARC